MKQIYIKPESDLCELESNENLLDGSVGLNLNSKSMGDCDDDLSKQRGKYDFDEEW